MKKQSSLKDVFGVILAGGRSSRLFPFNKVLSDLTGTGQSLLQQAVQRASGRLAREPFRSFIDRERIYILTAAPMVGPMRVQLKLPANRFLVDPVRRGTWPALLWAMAHLRHGGPATTLAVLTGDHVIGNVARFRQAVSEALALAQKEETIALIGVSPSARAEDWTGFGAFRGDGTRIIAFEEKPSLERARALAREGGWLWNAGMFFFRISVAEAALKRCQPAMYENYQRLFRAIEAKDRATAADLFAQFPGRIPHPLQPGREVDNTMDYAVLTPLVHGQIPGLGASLAKSALEDWKDVGQWPALRDIVKADRQGNVSVGQVERLKDVRRCILAADRGSSLSAQGVDGYVIAVSGKQALVIPEAQIGRLKELAAEAKDGQVVAVDSAALEIQFSSGRLQVRART